MPIPGELYTVTQGTYIGSNYVCIYTTKDQCSFLELNEMKNVHLSTDDVQIGITNKILELLENIPVDIMDVCKAQYEKNINN